MRLATIMLAVSGFAVSLHAAELRIDFETGKNAPVLGYGKNADEYAFAPAIELVINAYVFEQNGSQASLRSESDGGPFITEAESGRIRDQLEAALSAISAVAHARVRFEITSALVAESQDLRDGLNVVTLIQNFKRDAGNSGSGKSAIGLDGHGNPAITEFDIRMDLDYVMTRGHLLLLHELLHGIGLNHSWLTRDCLTDLRLGRATPPSIMSNGAGWAGLNADDEAAIARLYPRQWNRPSRTTGSVHGTVVAGSDAEEIYGAGVYLIDASGRPVAHRISGFGHVAPSELEAQTSGAFALEGVAPGTYDVLVASMADEEVILMRDGDGTTEEREAERTRGPGIIYLERLAGGGTGRPDASADFDPVDRERGWVRRIEVRAGELVDLGDVRFGEDREFLEPSGGTDRLEARWRGTAYSFYWFDFWSGGRLAHRSGWVRSARYAAELRTGFYWIRIYGWDGSQVRVLQEWASVDYRPEATSAGWERATRLTVTGYRSTGAAIRNEVEALEYVVSAASFGRPAEYRKGHGDRYTRAVTPAYRFSGNGAIREPTRGLDVDVFTRYHTNEAYSAHHAEFAPVGSP